MVVNSLGKVLTPLEAKSLRANPYFEVYHHPGMQTESHELFLIVKMVEKHLLFENSAFFIFRRLCVNLWEIKLSRG